MKNIHILILMFVSSLAFCQVGIGTQTPDSSAVLEVSVTNKGVVAAHVTLQSLTDVTTISTPAKGLLVYNTTINNSVNLSEGYYYWDGAKWVPIGNENKNYIIKNSFLLWNQEKYLGYELGSYSNAITPSGYTKVGCKKYPTNGHYYCAYSTTDGTGKDWQTAFNMAKSMKGYLVTITNNDEWNWIKNNIILSSTGYNLQNSIWMGFNKIKFPGNGIDLRWITGEVSRRNWSNNTNTENQFPSPEPNNFEGIEGCAHIYSNRYFVVSTRLTWNDTTCSKIAEGEYDTGGSGNLIPFSNFIIEFNN